MSKVLSIRINDDIAKRLEEISRETERAKSFHIQKALVSYIEHYADLQVALDRLNDQTDEVVSAKTMRDLLEL